MGAADFDEAFLRGARVASALVTSSAVADRWSEASVLPRMSVGMLACHLGKQLVHARDLATTPDGGGDVLPDAAEHYRRAAWVTIPDLDHPVNDRSRSEDEAGAGHDPLCARTRQALDDLEALISSDSLQDLVAIPWQGWRLSRVDFLLTRTVELVVHSDDLARSISIPTPAFPSDTFEAVLGLLTTLAAERHGQAELISALSRRERMPATISAF